MSTTLPFTSDASAPVDVPVDHLDYGYIDTCTDAMELKNILDVLRSGKEGRWYDLEKACEDKYISVLPPKQRKLYVAQITEPSFEEKQSASSELDSFLSEINKKDQALKQRKASKAEPPNAAPTDRGAIFADEQSENLPPKSQQPDGLPPVRGQKSVAQTTTTKAAPSSTSDTPYETIDDSEAARLAQKKQQRLSAYDWDAWEKFDVAKEIEKIEKEDATKAAKVEELDKAQQREAEKRIANMHAELEKLGFKMHNIRNKSKEELCFIANMEKQKGNECFKANELEEAYVFFSRAILLDPDQHVHHGNRALCAIKLKRFEQAENDCTKALELSPDYSKMYARRGIARHSRGKYLDAIDDFEVALAKNPQSKELNRLMAESRKKYNEVGGIGADRPGAPPRKVLGVDEKVKYTRMQIVEDDDDDSSSDEEDESPLEQNDEDVQLQPTNNATDTAKVTDQDDDSDTAQTKSTPDTAQTQATPEQNQSTTTQAQSTTTTSPSPPQSDETATLENWEDVKQQGVEAFKRRDLRGALSHFERAVQLTETVDGLAACHGNISVCYKALGAPRKAIKSCNTVLELQPNHIKSLLRRATMLEELGYLELALDDMCQVLRLDADHAQASNVISRLMGTLNDESYKAPEPLDLDDEPPLPEGLPQKDVVSPPQAPQVPVKHAQEPANRTQEPANRTQEPANHTQDPGTPTQGSKPKSTTVDSAKDAVVDSRQDALFHKQQGNSRFKQKDYAGAIKCYSTSLGMDASNSSVLSNRAMAHLKLGNFQACASDCTQGLDLKPEASLKVKLLYRRAQAHKGLGQPELALRDLEQVCALEPSNRVAVDERSTMNAQLSKAPARPVHNPSVEAEVKAMKEAAVVAERAKLLVKENTAASATFVTPTSFQQFDKQWKRLKGDQAARSKYLAAIPAKQIQRLFRVEIAEELMEDIGSCMDDYMADNMSGKCLDVLKQLSGLPRFQTTMLFLPKATRAVFERIFDRLYENVGARNQEKVVHVRHTYLA